MAKIKGKQLMVLTTAPDEEQGTRRTIAYATNHTLELSSNLDDVGTKDDNDLFVNQEVTSQSWSLTTENLIAADISDPAIPTYDSLLSAVRKQTLVYVCFSSLPDAMGKEREGTDWTHTGGSGGMTDYRLMGGNAYITSLELNAGNRENATYTATFTGYGAPSVYEVAKLNDGATEEVATASTKKSKKSETTETAES